MARTSCFPIKAFTLAEPLITLTIIGIIAAITIPNLMHNYRKKVVSTKFKKFYALSTQIKNLTVRENGSFYEIGQDELTSSYTPAQLMQYYEKYMAPYFTPAEVKKTQYGISIIFKDGSGALSVKSTGRNNPGIDYVHTIYCPNYKDCKELENDSNLSNKANGRSRFLFYYPIWTVPEAYATKNVDNHAKAVNACKNTPSDCTRLLYQDGWEIKDDYPFNF